MWVGRNQYEVRENPKGDWTRNGVRYLLLSVNGAGEIRWRVQSCFWSGDDFGQAAANAFGLYPVCNHEVSHA